MGTPERELGRNNSASVLAKPSFYLQNQAILKNQGLKESA